MVIVDGVQSSFTQSALTWKESDWPPNEVSILLSCVCPLQFFVVLGGVVVLPVATLQYASFIFGRRMPSLPWIGTY